MADGDPQPATVEWCNDTEDDQDVEFNFEELTAVDVAIDNLFVDVTIWQLPTVTVESAVGENECPTE